MKTIKAPIIQKFQNHTFLNLTVKTSNLRKIIGEYYPLLAILIAYLLVALSAGPYENGDTAWELDSVSGVLKYGLPYSNGSYLIDQPPLGFYIQAAFAKSRRIIHKQRNFSGNLVWIRLRCLGLRNRERRLQQNNRFLCRVAFCAKPLAYGDLPKFPHRCPVPIFQFILRLSWITCISEEFAEAFYFLWSRFCRCFQHKTLCCLCSDSTFSSVSTLPAQDNL